LEAHIEGAEGGRIAPDPPSAVFVGAPVILFGDTGQDGQSQLIIKWEKPQSGRLELPLDAPDSGLGETLRLLQGSWLVTDLDSRYLGETAERALDRREQKRIGDRLQALSETYGLASRRMSLVAVVERAGDQRGDIPKTTVVPVGMPQDVLFGAYFQGLPGDLRSAMPLGASMQQIVPAMFSRLAPGPLRPAIPSSSREDDLAVPSFARMRIPPGKPRMADKPLGTALGPEDMLLDLARQIEPDGGMPGKNDFERVVRSLVAVLAFLIEGHTTTGGAFRTHVQRLMHFLETSPFPSLGTQQRRPLNDALGWIKKGNAPPWKLEDLLAWEGTEALDRLMELVPPP
jgi:hypothetical protein